MKFPEGLLNSLSIPLCSLLFFRHVGGISASVGNVGQVLFSSGVCQTVLGVKVGSATYFSIGNIDQSFLAIAFEGFAEGARGRRRKFVVAGSAHHVRAVREEDQVVEGISAGGADDDADVRDVFVRPDICQRPFVG